MLRDQGWNLNFSLIHLLGLNVHPPLISNIKPLKLLLVILIDPGYLCRTAESLPARYRDEVSFGLLQLLYLNVHFVEFESIRGQRPFVLYQVLAVNCLSYVEWTPRSLLWDLRVELLSFELSLGPRRALGSINGASEHFQATWTHAIWAEI